MTTNNPVHKVFISFHHANDESYKNELEKLALQNKTEFISKAIQDGDIDDNITTETIYQKIRDNYIADATVTIVLIGKDTWKRKYVDWEIASSIRDTKKNSRNGLIGILLPTCDTFCESELKYSTTDRKVFFCKNKIPPRLWDNFRAGYADIYSWEYAVKHLKEIIDKAFKRRTTISPDNSRDRFVHNRPFFQNSWED